DAGEPEARVTRSSTANELGQAATPGPFSLGPKPGVAARRRGVARSELAARPHHVSACGPAAVFLKPPWRGRRRSHRKATAINGALVERPVEFFSNLRWQRPAARALTAWQDRMQVNRRQGCRHARQVSQCERGSAFGPDANGGV